MNNTSRVNSVFQVLQTMTDDDFQTFLKAGCRIFETYSVERLTLYRFNALRRQYMAICDSKHAYVCAYDPFMARVSEFAAKGDRLSARILGAINARRSDTASGPVYSKGIRSLNAEAGAAA